MLGTIAEQQATLTKLFTDCSMGDLVIILAYTLAAMESQIPGAAETFNETYAVFIAGYPNLLKQYKEANPDDRDSPTSFKFVVPDVVKPEKNPFLDETETTIVMPETGSIN